MIYQLTTQTHRSPFSHSCSRKTAAPRCYQGQTQGHEVLVLIEAHLWYMIVHEIFEPVHGLTRTGLDGDTRTIDDPFVHASITSTNGVAFLLSLTSYNSDGPHGWVDGFVGILIDTGCSRASIGRIRQYMSNCGYKVAAVDIYRTCYARCGFFVGFSVSVGITIMTFPFEDRCMVAYIHIVNDQVLCPPLPLLLSLADVERLYIFTMKLCSS